MRITLERMDEHFHLRASNEMGNTVDTDGSPDIGGSNKAMRPMQLMLIGLGSCSAIDIIHLLRKMRQDLKDIKITVTAEREPDKVPSLFTNIHVQFDLFGDIDPQKAQRAMQLSLEKYCSVAKLLEKTASITGSFTIQ